MAINGRGYDWEDIGMMLPSGESVGIKEIKYTDGQAKAAHYGRGAIPRAYGRGNYEASGSIVLYRDEWERLKKWLVDSGTGGIYDHKPFTIVISYANDDMENITDTLRSCVITKFDGGGGAQGDDSVSEITCELLILEPILWNGTPAKKNDNTLRV